MLTFYKLPKIFTIGFLLTLTLNSCETDKTRADECNKIVKAFTDNLSLDNYAMLYKYYPNFQKVKKYWKVADFEINNTTVDDDKTVSVIGSSQIGKIFFNLKKVNGKYLIINSKGLAAVFNTQLYKYCKEIGCIGTNDYDEDISQICSEKEEEFNKLVYKIKQNIESNVAVSNNNLTVYYGYVSGDVTVKNYSSVSIPGGTYQLYFHFLNSAGEIIFTKKDVLNYESIGYGQSITEHLFETSTGDFKKIKAELKLTSISFIENVLAENIKGSNCVANFNY